MARPVSVVTASVLADVSINIANVGANATLDVTATVAGLRKNRPVLLWTEGALDAGLNIGNAHCSAADTLKFRVTNATAGGIDPGALTFRVVQL